VALRSVEDGGVAEEFVDGYLVPAEDVERIKVIDDGEGVDLVEAGDDTVIFDVGEAADVKDELGPAALRSELEAGPFHIAIGQTEAFTHLTQAKAGDHGFLRRAKN
jgi:hypothetical protein